MKANRPSQTAVKVGRVLVWLSRQPELAPLLPKGAAEAQEQLLRQAGLLKPWMLRLFEHPGYTRFLSFIERHTLPGHALQVGLRKRFLEDEVRAALAEGARQVLVIGAGLDTLCPRLAAERPGLTCVEVDHPATQALKRAALEAQGALPSHLHLLGVDLSRTSLEEALSRLPAWRPDVPSVILAEGVLM